ncbi:MAG: isocitrate lyase/phosphoenolpyruvate mutase family protein [Hamadaea sp.]|uniref:isocitrate lyase/PEP mutase family protein n=1 Tax=Hamadaea sp. TaxID=2024425 RepID=UPI00180C8D62|nr:isocitrate lyase/phosphoenolpyruvate mutase family protein [Hamadaea sp.]NUR74605.1 isocitrate lyase/phosphoenolpyruvate mutase family protein [Hamadaea sp.]NUT17621.1 isocitrate lyase/phosphoenolpyruvate mutase family protein [Hamadaea sp.]
MNHAELFRSLHVPGRPLVLANAWDAASAAVVAAAGAPAVATTSAGVAWSLGTPDGDKLGRTQAVELIARVVRAVGVPVSADIEAGFGATPDEVAETVRAVIAAGAVGVNIEDNSHGGPEVLRPIAEQADRLTAVRTAAADSGLFVNARIDTYLAGVGGLAETVERANAYVAAGADGVFVPGVTDPATIKELVAAIPAPVNVLVGPGSPTVAELAELGVARASLGSAIAQAAYAVARRAAEEAYIHGTYASLADAVDYGTLNDLLRR